VVEGGICGHARDMKNNSPAPVGSSPVLVWFRLDLRLEDNPALQAAIACGGPVIPIFIWAPAEESPWSPGAASCWYLHHSLASLQGDLHRIGSQLIIRHGPTLDALTALLGETGARAVFWNRRYEPVLRQRDEQVKTALREMGVEATSFNGALLNEPWTVKNRSGGPFQVFTPFWRHCLSLPEPPKPLPAARQIASPAAWPSSVGFEALTLLPKINWAEGLNGTWKAGSGAAKEHLERFLVSAAVHYDIGRDFPAEQGTSRLSPHLHFGEISPRQVWWALKESSKTGSSFRDSRFLVELGWREFSHHLLYHFPTLDQEPLRKEFVRMRWHRDAHALEAWERGRTGYPMVDAGMRELWHTGWMHNRVRMIAASFLVKHLLAPWQEGARWFWDTLVDADLAQNSMGWQWVAGCGADAAPFFRIFNPVLQGEKFDPSGAYIRRWVPELARVPERWIHEPHRAPSGVLTQAGVEIGTTYPHPVVNHVIAREVALEAYSRLRAKG
jgi:deoxyribodipyrimidine photo-lyase